MAHMFSHRTEAFPCRKAKAASVAKILLEKIIPTLETLLELESNQRTILLVKFFDKSMLFGQFYNTFIVHNILNPQG